MCRCRKRNQAKQETGDMHHSGIYVSVDVTKIVKYVAVAGVLIIGIIFGTGIYRENSVLSEKTNEE